MTKDLPIDERAALCKRCGNPLVDGMALQNALVGSPDFVGDTGNEVGRTMSYSGKARMIACLKCPVCGYSKEKGKQTR